MSLLKLGESWNDERQISAKAAKGSKIQPVDKRKYREITSGCGSQKRLAECTPARRGEVCWVVEPKFPVWRNRNGTHWQVTA